VTPGAWLPYHTNLWTTARIAEVIVREFGVNYHPDAARMGAHIAFADESGFLSIPNVVKT
jgi:hypothetical protein